MREIPDGYSDAIARARTGEASTIPDAETPFGEVKVDFYADARVVSEAVLGVLKSFETITNPHGLVNKEGEPDMGWMYEEDPWEGLEHALYNTISVAFGRVQPPLAACPYHFMLAEKMHQSNLRPKIDNVSGLETLRSTIAPGGLAAPALTVGLVRRMPAMRLVHGLDTPSAELARNSRGLLKAPLAHAQQHAKAFMFTLVNGSSKSNFTFSREKFLPIDVIRENTKATITRGGREKIEWSKPTSEFVLRGGVTVPSRVKGSSKVREGDHMQFYPIGTKLGDIVVDEPVFGCPGDMMAYWIYDKTINIAEAENLWFQD